MSAKTPSKPGLPDPSTEMTNDDDAELTATSLPKDMLQRPS